MKKGIDWNYERYRTRDLLLHDELENNIYIPKVNNILINFPYQNNLSYQLYQLATKYGFVGTEQEFLEEFGNNYGKIIHGTLNTFPEIGDPKNFYFDEETAILYYFKIIKNYVSPEDAARINAAIVGYSTIAELQLIETYIYIPVKAASLENSLLQG